MWRINCLFYRKKNSILFILFITSPCTNSSTNLMDYNDTHVLDFEPTLKTLAIMTVLENNIDQTWLPQEIR